MANLSERQQALMTAFLAAWESASPGRAHQPFDLESSRRFDHPNWPEGVGAPTRDDVRGLLALGMLESDRRAAPTWRVFPSAEALKALGGTANDEAAALSDPDRRLGLILDAVVAAFEAAPSEPLQLMPLQQLDWVRHEHWRLQPNAVKQHDLDQLEDLGLIASRGRGDAREFWPTAGGRFAVSDPAGYLEKLAADAPDEPARSRFTGWAKRVRAGDVAVGALSAASGAVIKALLGL